MEYNEGDEIEFNIYGSTVVGDIVRETKDDKVVIKTTKDFVECNIGEEQSIHKSHRRIIRKK